MTTPRKIPATIVTGFLGAGKTTLIRHVLENAGDRRLALIINEFGDVGVDGEILRACGVENCPEENIVELANGCLCCTVADDFLPTMQKLIDRAEAAGSNNLLLNLNVGAMPNKMFLEQIRRFGREVLPILQAHEVKRVPVRKMG